MKRIIQWESQHLEIDTMTGKIRSPIENSFEEDYFNNSDNYIEQELKTENVISTPFGLWRVDDTMNPYKQFKLWMGNTNFTITKKVVDAIRTIPGIEILKVLTRYKFIVGVGQLFEFKDVRTAIEKALSCHTELISLIKDDKVKQQVMDLQNQLSQYKKWAIYVFPNGQLDFTTSNEEDYNKKLGLFRQAVDYSNGILIENT